MLTYVQGIVPFLIKQYQAIFLQNIMMWYYNTLNNSFKIVKIVHHALL